LLADVSDEAVIAYAPAACAGVTTLNVAAVGFEGGHDIEVLIGGLTARLAGMVIFLSAAVSVVAMVFAM
jgi:hypothetical protein